MIPSDRLRSAVRGAGAVVRIAPTVRLAVALAACAPLWLAGGWLGGGALLIVLAAALVDLATLPSTTDLDVQRTLPAAIGVGDDAEGSYTIESRWSRPLRVTLFDALPAQLVRGPSSFQELPLPARGTAGQRVTVAGVARGEDALGAVALRVRTPIGLVSRIVRYSLTDRVLVAPSIAGVKRFRWLAVHHRLSTVGVRNARRLGEGRAFSRLRDYVIGDDPRHIDWKATARRGHPITREFTVEQSQTVFVLIDAGRSMTQLSGDFARFEYALSSALLLADVALTAGDRVGAMVFDDRLRALIPAQRGATALHALRSALIPVQATMVEPDYATAFRTLALRQRKRALIVLITDVIDGRAARGLLGHLTRGASRHLAVVVALRNEALVEASRPLVGGADALFTGAAAEELLAERAAGLHRMREAGVVVLDVAPGAMAAAVVNQYLELKARGAL